MSISKKKYELSIWKEILEKEGFKTEKKEAIIGAHDMDYLGRATNIKFKKKVNGTHELTFQLPDKFFDSEKGEFIHNEFVDYLFNEKKVKLFYKEKWYEFYVKSTQEQKNFKSYLISYTCTDSFIEELSRNGYGITFDTELYNNVEEIGIFSEEILEDSLWEYDAHLNIGDFTEFSEERFFKIPVSFFSKISGYKLNYDCGGAAPSVLNVYTKRYRNLEIGDDLARQEKYFWDNGSYDNGFQLTEEIIDNIPNDGFIYVPYTSLSFCYVTTNKRESLVATEEAAEYVNGVDRSYALAPNTIDPSALIQFIAIPEGATVDIDENQLLLNKNYTYVMTVKQWNEALSEKGNQWYAFEDVDKKEIRTDKFDSIHGNMIVGYQGYLNGIGKEDIYFAKKISISDRTECNISKEVDQYVKVYQNKSNEYKEMFTSEDWEGETDEYRVCSKMDTRQIIPQLARNLLTNATEISSADGWEIMSLYDGTSLTANSAELKTFTQLKDDKDIEKQYLEFIPAYDTASETTFKESMNTFINFGITGQEKEIEKGRIYCLGIDLDESVDLSQVIIRIGEGTLVSSGEYGLNDEAGTIVIGLNKVILDNKGYILFKPSKTIKNPYFTITSTVTLHINSIYLFEAYTKGIDFFEDGIFKYSGRELFDKYLPNKQNETLYEQEYTYSNIYSYEEIKKHILFETDIMEGTTYTYNRYFIQQLKLKKEKIGLDTFMAKEYLNPDVDYDEKNLNLPLSSSHFTEDDYEIVTNYIDMNQCAFYKGNVGRETHDCLYSKNICLYQKYGYCPYLFKTQKHCRKIRTLNGEKSNRFNLTQEVSKIFEVYPVYYVDYEENGKVKTDENGKPQKRLFYMTEKGNEKKIGFRYERNLSNISRTKNSQEIVTKLYVEDNDSELSRTGLCSIKTAEDNPSKDSFIIDFSYYNKMGLLDEETSNADLYGNNREDQGYLKTLGYYNTEYDKLSNKIINLQNASFNELEANLIVNLEGIETSQKQLIKIKKQMDRYRTSDTEKSDTYENYLAKYTEQLSILSSLIEETFYTDGVCLDPSKSILTPTTEIPVLQFLDYMGMTFSLIKERWFKTHKYTDYGMMGQFCTEYNQIQEWKKEREKYLKDINRISINFFRKYEPFLKEGTWSDSNYIDDNAYYFGAKEVAKQGAIPKAEYTIDVIDLSSLAGFEDYEFDVADTTYVEDIGMFGINQKTGFPNQLKTIISEIEDDLDNPINNKMQIQNYTTQFEDLFEQVTATVQQLSFNENIYSRASNFTSTQNIKADSLQGALDENNITLLNTNENNINLDSNGQAGSDINNHSNKYKLNGQGLFFSNNGGQTWNVGVGPGGINADYIKVGQLDAGKVRIVDSNYLYFLWDKNGIIAYKDPQNLESGDNHSFNDYSIFNKFGLSLVKNGQIRLRAGYSFTGEGGMASKEIKTGKEIGFYLYNDQGDVIFKTENNANVSERDLTARLSLIGEMYVTDSVQGQSGGPSYRYSIGHLLQTIQAPILSAITKNYRYRHLEKGADAPEYNYYYCDVNEEINESVINNIFVSIQERELTRNEIFITKGINGYICFNPIEVLNQLSTPAFKENGTLVDINKYVLNYKRIYTDTIRIENDIVEEFEIVSQSGNIEANYYIDYIDSYFQTSTQECKIEISNNAEMGVTLQTQQQSQLVTYYVKLNGLYSMYANRTLYNIEAQGFNYFESEHTNPSSPEGNTIGLYLNNTSLNNKANNSRLICCAKNSGNNGTTNIFSILKNGNLYIGGQITSNTNEAFNATNVPIEINVEGALLAAENGKIRLSFENLLDANGNSLSNRLNSNHYHTINGDANIIMFDDGQDLWMPTQDDIEDIIQDLYDRCIDIGEQDCPDASESNKSFWGLLKIIMYAMSTGEFYNGERKLFNKSFNQSGKYVDMFTSPPM